MSWLSSIFKERVATPQPRLRPLTQAGAESLGHVLWIEEKTPHRAYSHMFEALRPGSPYNCAVWANAGEQIDRGFLSQLQEWRSHSALRYQNHTKETHDSATPLGPSCRKYLSDSFSRLHQRHTGQPNAQHIAQYLLQHVATHTSAIIDTIHPKDLLFDLRADKHRTLDMDVGKDTAHTDGDSLLSHTHKAMTGYTYRLLQSLASPSTCLVSNSNAVPIGQGRWGLDDNKPVTFYQTPENSVVLLTNSRHHAQPILHSEALHQPGRISVPRTVSVMDLVL